MIISKEPNDKRLIIALTKEENLIKGLNFEFFGWDNHLRTFYNHARISSSFTLHIVLSGKGTYITNNQIFNLKKGNYFLFLPNTTISYYPDVYDPWEYCWLGLSSENLFDLFLKNGEKINLTGFLNDMNYINKLVNKIKSFNNDENKPSLIQLNGLFLSILNEILFNRTLPTTTASKQEPSIIMKANEYIALNYYNNISISDLSKHLFIDTSTLFRVFKKHYNLSPQKYIINFKLNTARDLLYNSNLSLQEICFKCGFNSYAYFSRAYKNHFHVLPSEEKNSPKSKI